MKTLAKKSLLWVTVAFLLFVLVSAIRIGVVELLSINAHLSLDEWDFTNQPPSASEVESVARQLEIVRMLADGNPGTYEDVAYLNLMRAWLPGISLAEKEFHRQTGMSAIRTAIALRPVSPYSWTILLLIKRDLGEFDAEFRHALHLSVELGPWEPELLIWQADVGLSAWTEMPEEEQALIQQVFVRGMERQRRQIIDVFLQHLDDCAFQATDSMQRTECQ